MRRWTQLVRPVCVAAVVAAAAIARPPVTVHGQDRLVTVLAGEVAQLRDWDARISNMLRDGELDVRQVREDTLVPGRQHERLVQLYKGVPVFGGDLTRQTDGGITISIFGRLHADIEVDPTPALTPEEARAIVEKRAGVQIGLGRLPTLVIVPLDAGGYALAYRVRAFTGDDLRVYFVDAQSGEVRLEYSDLQTAVGTGRGVLGDQKKISTRPQSGAFVAQDVLRPPAITTYDMRGNLSRTLRFLDGFTFLTQSDLASDADNAWTDGASVDAHVYAGWTYDYYFKRFGRRGLDNANIEMVSLVHPVRREDVLSQPNDVIGLFYLNAFYAGDGLMVYGEGLPPNVLTTRGQRWDFLAGGLDVVSHELTHGVTDYSSQLIYRNESGALNEGFSDVMGASVEFFFQAAGNGVLRADYLIGEDVVVPGGLRSIDNPASLGNPDHYSRRFTGTEDNGGVHTNSTIGSHAFYLAIEGGVNRTSGLSVQGVGATNREQIEKVFYRAFAQLLPSSATFAVARAACIQAARDLYGAGGTVERAVTQAWTAVGVN